MSTGGLSKARLGRMHDVMAGHVERGAIPGLVTLVSRRGETHVDAIGTKALGGSEPMARDTIFRIASMTKPITAVGAMVLVEECTLRLDEPVDSWLPELSNRRVLRRLDAALDDTVPGARPITLRDLLTFRMGVGVVMAPSGTYPICDAMRDLQLGGMGPPRPHEQPATDEWMRRLGALPLMHQPDEKWMYHTASDVLGVLIERASGQRLEVFLHDRVLEQLGMKDTGFSVSPSQLDRLAACYEPDAETGTLRLFDGVSDSQWSTPPAFASGGGGLVSTIDDILAFGQMMLDAGMTGGERLLSRPSIEMMTTDHLTPEQKARSEFAPGYWESNGWGFGMSVATKRVDASSAPGRFGWFGGLGTAWYSDPYEEMVTVLMTQRSGFPLYWDVFVDFMTGAYQAIDD
jgi:CubicO group peptidase (beta-lactamase class C family)